MSSTNRCSIARYRHQSDLAAYAALSDLADPYRPCRNPTDEMDLRIEGGNSGLVNALAERIGLEAIHTDMEVQSVTQTDQRVAVKAEDVRTRPFAAPQSRSKAAHRSLPTKKRTFAAAYCICTVPARSLNSITWKPALEPTTKWLAARNLQYAKIMKTVLLFKTRFWEKRMGNTWCKPSMTT